MIEFPVLLVPPKAVTDPGTVRLGDGVITAEFPPRRAERPVVKEPLS
jgi:hypothetical protein